MTFEQTSAPAPSPSTVDEARRFAEIQARADALAHYEATPDDGPNRPANRSIRIEQAKREIERHAIEDIPWMLDRLAAVGREERERAARENAPGYKARMEWWRAQWEIANDERDAERTHRERLEAVVDAARAWIHTDGSNYEIEGALTKAVMAYDDEIRALAAASGDAPALREETVSE